MDKIVQNVIDKFNQRSARGVAKYGTTLADNNTDDFLTHLQEELMDAVLYIEKLKQLKNYNYYVSKIYQIKDKFYVHYPVKEDDHIFFELVPQPLFIPQTNPFVKYVLIDEFSNPELFEGEPIFTDKRYAKIIY